MMKILSMLMVAVMLLGNIALAENDTLTMEDIADRLMNGTALEELHAHFTPEMQTAVPLDQLATLGETLQTMGGFYEGISGDTNVTEADGSTVMTQRLHMAMTDMMLTVVLNADGQIAGLNFALCASNSDAAELDANVTEEEVTIGEAPWQLPGTLTIPTSDTPVPVVVLVHGSGPNDRNETNGQTALFRDLAEALSAKGIAVLRYEKRTKVYGQEIATSADYAAFTIEEETIQDAIAAGKLLKADSRIDASRIYVLGHSLGAMMTPRIVSEADGLFCGMIMACGTNRTLLDVIFRQNADAIAQLTDDAARAEAEGQLEAIAEQAETMMSMTKEQAMSETLLGQPAWYFIEMAQAPTAADYLNQLALPTLIMNGSRDFQVTTEEGQHGWEQALDMDASWLETLWADVNHMLMKPEVDAAVAGTSAEYAVPCKLDEDVADTIAAFILNTEEK